MELGLALDPGRSWPDLVTLARAADELGLRSLYLCDHFVAYGPDELPPPVEALLEGWTTLTALSQLTSRVRLGPLVLGNTYRHPAVVANMAAALDQVSRGRAVLGLGAGWQRNEHEALGIVLPEVGLRLDALEEAVAVIRSLLTNERTTFPGRHYQLLDAPCEPKPIQAPLPLLIGGGGERRTLPLAARWAHEWHTWADVAVFTHKSRLLDELCVELGRDPASLRRLTGGVLDPATTASTLQQYRLAGADEFVVRDRRALPVAQAVAELTEVARQAAIPGF